VITDQNNGTYTVTLPPNLSGKCELSVQFEGQNIKGSPLHILPNDFFGGSKRFEVLYDAKVHGYSTATFHQKCDNIDGTVTLVTLQNGAKFGGYNPSRWSGGDYKNIPNTFLFSLTDGKGSGPQKWQCTKDPQYSIYCSPGYGPTFGGKFV